jgi:glycosyltransferase involved in cell wall biosynthesis
VALMRICIDASTWYNGRGFGRFTREIVTELLESAPQHDYVLLFDQPPPPHLAGRSVVVEQRRPVIAAATANGRRAVGDLLRFTGAARRARADVLFYPAVYSWFPAPLGLRNLVTLHDAISEHFPTLVFPRRSARLFWNLKVALARAQATRFLTVSEAARQEIVAHLGIDPTRIDLTTEGPGRIFTPPRDAQATRAAICGQFALPADAPLFLYVGGFAPHKNVGRLLEAFERFRNGAGRAAQLLLVGALDSHGFSSNIEQLRGAVAASAVLRSCVRFTGFVPDPTLRDLYGSAVALVLPSLSEGFGLPAIEAMACGTPVLASARASLPELVGRGGLLFDPESPEQIADCLDEALTDSLHAGALRVRAYERAAAFTWQAAAQSTLAALERCTRSH